MSTNRRDRKWAVDVRPGGTVESTFLRLTKSQKEHEEKLAESGVFDDDMATELVWGIVAEVLTEDADYADFFEGHALSESITEDDLKILEMARVKVRKIAEERSGIFSEGIVDGFDTLTEG